MTGQQATQSILDSLRRLVQELRVFSRRAENRVGLTAAQLFLLQCVAERQPVSINGLAQLTFTHQSSVSEVTQRLEQRGLLTRRKSAQDGRRRELVITPAGRQALKRAPVAVQNRLIDALSAMKDTDRQTLARLLDRLVRSIGLEDRHPVLFFEQDPPGPRRAGRTPRHAMHRRENT